VKLGQTGWPKLMLRLPPDLKAWVAEQAEKHGNSQNAEIVRAVRERAERDRLAQPVA
jgi:predicted HicB family RNase H-like nuclease